MLNFYLKAERFRDVREYEKTDWGFRAGGRTRAEMRRCAVDGRRTGIFGRSRPPMYAVEWSSRQSVASALPGVGDKQFSQKLLVLHFSFAKLLEKFAY